MLFGKQVYGEVINHFSFLKAGNQKSTCGQVLFWFPIIGCQMTKKTFVMIE